MRYLGQFLYVFLRLARRPLPFKSERSRCVLVCDGEVLLVKNFLGLGKWKLPGGGIKRNELAKESARREVYEELGISLDELQYIGEFHDKDQSLDFTYHCFKSEVKSKDVKINYPEILDYMWADPSNLPKDTSEVTHKVVSEAKV